MSESTEHKSVKRTESSAAGHTLGVSAMTAMVIGSMIGAGIFMAPARFAAVSGVWGTVLTWVIAGFGMLTIAFVIQHLAIRKPQLDDGIFSYAREGFGPYVGFIAAIGFWAGTCAGNTTFLVLTASTMGKEFPALFGKGDTIGSLVLGSVLIWAFFLLSCRGSNRDTRINTIVTLAKVIPLVIFIVLALFAFNAQTFTANLTSDVSGTAPSLLGQVRATLLITVFFFLGIEGASVYSRHAKSHAVVGRATLLGFGVVLTLLVLVSLLPYALLPQAQIAALQQPSLGGVMEAIAGRAGGVLISLGLLVAVLGAYLTWTLMAAEVLYTAALGKDLPSVFTRTNAANVPVTALLASALLTQLILVVTFFSTEAVNFAVDLTSALALLPFLFSAAYALKIALRHDGYSGVTERQRRFDLAIAALAVLYIVFILAFAGYRYVPLTALVLAPATALYVFSRKEYGLRVFKWYEWVVLAILCVLAIVAIAGIATGFITL